MMPSSYRGGGSDAEIRFAIGECSLGSILVAQSDRGICTILLGDDPDKLARDLQVVFPAPTWSVEMLILSSSLPRWSALSKCRALGWICRWMCAVRAFQQRVWQALRGIPAGQTVSYSDIAKRIGAPKSVRAVAQACATNKLAVAIPCHRVVRNDGALAGYRWGVERKRTLLEKESKAGGEMGEEVQA